jgi:hypothetical protein
MLKRTIKYTDFNGEEREEDFYFNLTKAEVMELELSTEGGLVQKIQKIVAARDSEQILTLFKGLILNSYGEKSPDGKRFIKNAELKASFEQTEAYSDLFMELASDADAAAAFVAGIIPQAPPAKQ